MKTSSLRKTNFPHSQHYSVAGSLLSRLGVLCDFSLPNNLTLGAVFVQFLVTQLCWWDLTDVASLYLRPHGCSFPVSCRRHILTVPSCSGTDNPSNPSSKILPRPQVQEWRCRWPSWGWAPHDCCFSASLISCGFMGCSLLGCFSDGVRATVVCGSNGSKGTCLEYHSEGCW